MPPKVWWLSVLFPLFFVAMWVVTLKMISTMSGWGALAKRFRDHTRSYKYLWLFQSARMRFYAGYGSCVNIGADESGLRLAVFAVFRMGHPPLRIPWDEISVKAREYGILFKKRELLLGQQEAIPFRISKSLANKVQQAAGRSWPVEIIGD
jgi:hypothetical protein